MSVIISDIVLKTNKTERLPCVLIVDGSTSMCGGPIAQLTEGLVLLERNFMENDDIADGVQIAIIRMGGHDEITVLSGFVDAAEFTAPIVEANETTPIRNAVDHAMGLIEDQKQRYRDNRVSYKRPWLAPSDAWQPVARSQPAPPRHTSGSRCGLSASEARCPQTP